MENNNAVQPQTKMDAFKGLLNSQTTRAQVAKSLKENAGAFLSSMLDLYSGDSSLQSCRPESVIRECLKAASLNLPLVKTLGFAYVVPFKNEPTFVIGYKGLIQLAQRTGQYLNINADVVYEGELKSKNKLSGMIDISGQATSDKAVGYFAYFRLINGFEKTYFMTKADVEAYAKRYSPSYNASFSPWKNEFDKMALKTVIRQLIKTYGIMSIEMQTALATDDDEAANNKAAEDNANKTPLHIDENTGEVTGEGKAAEPQAAEFEDLP